jgi:shikimate kinase
MTDSNPISLPIRQIVLTGFMGSGKSTVGPLLAQRLGWQFIDSDDAIIAQARMPIHEFFASYGEPAFRALEQSIICRLATLDSLVLSMGGGAIETETTRNFLLSAPTVRLIHLDAALETSLTRCSGTESIRPVLADAANLRARYEKRLPLYRMAHHSISVDALTPEEVVQAILMRLKYPETFPAPAVSK